VPLQRFFHLQLVSKWCCYGVVAEITLSGVAAAAALLLLHRRLPCGTIGGAGILIHKAFKQIPIMK
jgi:hypothetical protein